MAATNTKKTPTITVLGSLNIDLVSYVSHHPLPGETMTSTRFVVSPGGKGANQAVACAKLSRPRHPPSSSTPSTTQAVIDPGTHRHASASETAHVRMVGAAGDASSGTDGYGDLLVSNLRAQGVDASGVRRPAGLKTGIAVIVVDEPTGQNRIILSPEANHFLQPEHFDDHGDQDWSLSQELLAPGNRPDLLIMQLEIPMPTVLRALRAARENSIPVLLNPAPAVPLPAEAYAGLAHLIVNETEAAILGSDSDSKVSEADLETEAGLEVVARKFIARGVRTVVVTLGGRGVYYLSVDSTGGDVRKGLVPAEKANVVDTTAAGDTFVGVYALEVVQAASSAGTAFDVGAAVLKANHAAAKTVERRGAQDSIPWRDELDG